MPKLPQAKDWDHFWKKARCSRPKKVSWAKKRVCGILSRYIQPNMRVLDAGCGSGFFSRFFYEQGCAVTALDYSLSACAAARSLTGGHVRVIQADFLQDSLPPMIPEKVDLVFSDGIFEHFAMAEQDKIMQNFLSVLSTGGLCITFVPNRFSPWQLIRPFFMPGIEEMPFVLSGLKDLNARNGLEIIDCGGVNVLPFKFSLDAVLGKNFGMLLYAVGRKG